MTWKWGAVANALFPRWLGQPLSSSRDGDCRHRSFRTEQTQAASLPEGRRQADVGTVFRQLPWIVQTPAYLWGRVIKKCREKQRQQATKQPGGRTESVNQSHFSLPYCASGTVLWHNPIYFTKEVQRRIQPHLSFSPLTQRILGTLITS